MFSRAYKMVVTVPPLVWVTVFLLVPYSLMFCYSFWSVSPTQAIVHSWNLENYKELLQKTVYWTTLLRSMWIAGRGPENPSRFRPGAETSAGAFSSDPASA